MINVCIQAGALFILLLIGLLCGKLGFFNAQVRAGLCNVLLFITTPAMVLEAFQFDYSPEILLNMLYIFGVSLAVMVLTYLLASLVYRKHPLPLKRVLLFGLTFSNVGFLGLPVLQSILGDLGVIYGSVYVASFNLLNWTLGVTIFTGQRNNPILLLKNPTLISVFVGMALFCLSWKIPNFILKPITMLSACNGPMSMLTVGSILASCSFKDLVGDLKLYSLTGLRLLAVPAIAFGICTLLHLSPEVTGVLVLASGTPAAVNTAIFATKYGGNERFASLAVVMTTLLYLPVVPLWTWIVGLA